MQFQRDVEVRNCCCVFWISKLIVKDKTLIGYTVMICSVKIQRTLKTVNLCQYILTLLNFSPLSSPSPSRPSSSNSRPARGGGGRAVDDVVVDVDVVVVVDAVVVALGSRMRKKSVVVVVVAVVVVVVDVVDEVPKM